MKLKISKPKIKSSHVIFFRLLMVFLLIAFDYALINRLLQANQLQFSTPVVKMLGKLGVQLPQALQTQFTVAEFNLDSDYLLEQENQQRIQNNLSPLDRDPDLDQVARLLAQAFATDEYQVENHDYKQVMEEILTKVDYPYQVASEIALVGPRQTDQVLDIWLKDEAIREEILDKNFIKTGLYTAEDQIGGYATGITIQVFVQPASAAAAATPKVAIYQQSAREVPDSEVISALNQYRADHSIHPLQIDNRLCTYAEKRVQDLISHGGLDNHQGFIEDFKDPNNYPSSLVEYPGTGFGENLASQFCINGTTKQSFVAETGTSLIEWCFDSSIRGHREAQLNPKYNSVCARHGNNMYVIIFGE